MHRRSFPIVLVIVVLSVFLLFSCDNELEPPPKGFSTPTIVGRVSLPEGSGLSPNDIWIKIIEEETTKYVGKAGSDGSFAVSGLDASKKYDVLFTSIEPEQMNYSRALESRAAEDTEGYGGWLNQVSAAINEGNDVGSVKMKPMGTIKGVALIDGESEHYDITVYVPGTSFIARTAADGSFSMFNVPQGTYRLRYALASHVSVMSDEFIMTSGGSETEHPITTVPTVTLISDSGSVEGVATLDGAVDNSGIIIKLEKDDLSYSYTATTSENGSFTINGVRPGSYRLLASYAGYPTQTSNYFTVSVATTTTIPESLVLFENVGGISGSAGLADNEMVKAGIMIICRNLDTDIAYSTVTNEEGVFKRVLPSGNYRITASYPGYSSHTAEVEVLMGGSSTVTLAALVSADGAVSGRIVLDGALDSSGAVVTVTCASDSSITRNAVTDINGVFRIYGLSKAGQYYIDASKEGYLSSSSAVDVSLGTVAEASVITLKSRMSKISGTVTLAGTTNHTGINVLIKAKDNSRQYDATTAQDGTYVIASVLPGVYDLYASKAGYESKASADITIEPSSVKTIDSISLAVAQRSIYGNVQLELRTDHAGALITATKTSDPNKVYSAISNSAGDYSLAGMEPGEYRIVITSSGYRTLTLPTTDVIANSTANLETVDLIVARGTISGLIKLEGWTDYSGIRVELVGTSEETTTTSSGYYSFHVPAGNYAGGVRFSKIDFETTSDTGTITVLTDSTYAVPERTLGATHNTIRGTVDVDGTNDDSGVVVSIDGTSFSMVTLTDGKYRFDHVPLGDYTLRYQRENAPVVTTDISVIPALEVIVPTTTLLPQQASIHGYVTLDGMTNYTGITVEVENNDTLQVVTATSGADGYFYIPNILTSGAYTVSYSKQGWDTQSMNVTGLTPLENRNLTLGGPVVLLDTTPPQIGSFSINTGSNFTDNKNVSLNIPVIEQGSGTVSMQLRLNGNPVSPNWLPYSIVVTKDLEEIFAPNYVGNGEYTISVRVKDLVGNVSGWMDDSITLTDQKTVVKGVLSDSQLHWTKENSPYRVEGNILVEAGKTLIIDPGVDVLFAGEYSLMIDGSIWANGSDEQRIRFVNDTDFSGFWKGIVISYMADDELSLQSDVPTNGNYVNYVTIMNANIGIASDSTVFISNSTFSNIKEFGLAGSAQNTALANSIVCNNLFLSDVYFVQTGDKPAIFTGNTIRNAQIYFEQYHFMHNFIIDNNVFDKCSIKIQFHHQGYSVDGGFSFIGNTLLNISVPVKIGTNGNSGPKILDFHNTSFIDCSGVLVDCRYSPYTARKLDVTTINFSGSYWGFANTEEIQAVGNRQDVSFIYDYFDDFSLTEIDYSRPFAVHGG